MKRCLKCNNEKELTEFYKDSSKKDKLYPWCRSCANAAKKKSIDPQKEAARSKQNYKNNPEYYKQYRKKHPYKKWYEVHKEEKLKYNKEWYERNPNYSNQHYEQHKIKKAIYSKEYYKENKKEILENNRKWRKNNPDKRRVSVNNRIARKKNNGGTLKTEEWKSLKEEYNYTCLSCGKKEPDIKLEIDHVVSLVAGGRNSIENIQPLCRSCNASKSSKTIDYRKRSF